ncbi:hypothetical protein [Polaromonas hydrogenivorans]|uniref:hypothetical protein n=1 Tax=Polaromonas hydrogenivorans TaxID=335476 RepID=UPI0039F10E74
MGFNPLACGPVGWFAGPNLGAFAWRHGVKVRMPTRPRLTRAGKSPTDNQEKAVRLH